MPHGTPDWGLVGPKSTVYGLDDLGELGVRLGSPVVWDRRGDVVFATDFRNGAGDVYLDWVGAAGGSVLHAGNTRQGAYCLKLTAGSDLTLWAAVTKNLPFLVSGRLGMEVSFSYDTDTDYVYFDALLESGAGRWEPALRFYPNTGVLEVRTAPLGGFVQVTATAAVNPGGFCCNTVKMVFDTTRVFGVYTGYYVRAIVNDIEYPLDIHPIFFTAGAWVPLSSFEFYHYGTALKNPVVYLDCFIITQNED